MEKTIGKRIVQNRKRLAMTQEQLAEQLGVTAQAVSKWENKSALPDIMILPKLADYFGVSIDELMDYKLNALTYKEQFVKFMLGNGILQPGRYNSKNGMQKSYYIDTEKFTTNAQIAKIGEFFADCIRENNVEFDAIMGLAYHGVAFSTAAACALFNKYGITTDYCFDRKTADSRGRMICGHTLKDGDRVVMIEDVTTSGKSMEETVPKVRGAANVEIKGLMVSLNRMEVGKGGEKCALDEVKDLYGFETAAIVDMAEVVEHLYNKEYKGEVIINDTLKEAIDAQRTAAINQSLSGLSEGLAGIGTEAEQRSWLNGLIESGAMEDYLKGTKYANSAKKGGRLLTKKRK